MVTAGSSTAYTLSYSVAPTALADGMTHLLRFHTTNGAAATLNVNALGAKPLFAYIACTWMAAPAGAFPADFIARVAYDNASGNYRILGMSNCLRQNILGRLDRRFRQGDSCDREQHLGLFLNHTSERCDC
jgi:hypothetical protein